MTVVVTAPVGGKAAVSSTASRRRLPGAYRAASNIMDLAVGMTILIVSQQF